MADLKAVADAIALRFLGATAGGKGFASAPTASLPNTLGKGPVCLVYHPTGDLDIGLGKMRNDHFDFPVKILIDPLNVPARSDRLYAWYTATRDLVEGKLELGLSYVKWARLTDVRIEIDGEKYGDNIFDVVEYTVRVLIIEPVPTVNV